MFLTRRLSFTSEATSDGGAKDYQQPLRRLTTSLATDRYDLEQFPLLAPSRGARAGSLIINPTHKSTQFYSRKITQDDHERLRVVGCANLVLGREAE